MYLTCKNHPRLRWICKAEALDTLPDGSVRYNGQRGLHYYGPHDGPYERECDCSTDDLRAIRKDEPAP